MPPVPPAVCVPPVPEFPDAVVGNPLVPPPPKPHWPYAPPPPPAAVAISVAFAKRIADRPPPDANQFAVAPP